MSDENQKTVPYFSDEDRLQLLQLMTKRSMAERQSQMAEQKDGTGATPLSEADSKIEGWIAQWRLLPEGLTLYKWQQKCLPLWLSRGRGTVKVATGGGKTLFALAVAQQLQNEVEPNLRLVVVVPTIPLMYQWYDEVRMGNLPESAIGLMGGGRKLPPHADLRVLICVLNSARDLLPKFVADAGWAEHMLLVVDECHRANAEQAQRIFDAKPKYTLGLSATPEQELEDEALPTDEAYEQSVVGSALGPIIFDFSIKESLTDGLLTPFEVWHIGLPLAPDEASEHSRLSREITDLRKALQRQHRNSRSKQNFLAWCQTQATRGGTAQTDAARFIGLANRRKRLLFQARARTDVVLGILSESAADPDGRAIVFHESIDEIEALFLRAIELTLPAVLEHSQLPESLRAENIDAFRKGVARVIISAKSLVEGFNVPSADLGIIAASSGSVRQRIQSLGRMLRRKGEGRSARIIVLYARDTEDEAIYEKADWETIIGAERNRYFRWDGKQEDALWTTGLKEVFEPPRLFRPSSWDVDVSDLRSGDPYPGQLDGLELKVDQSGNLRSEDDELAQAPAEFIAAILERSPYRRARRTPAGHLIVRNDLPGAKEADWRYLGLIDLPKGRVSGTIVHLRLKTSSGKRMIAVKDEGKNRGNSSFALGPEASRTPEGGQARDQLLEWTRSVKAERGVEVKDIFWDGGTCYWLEIGNEHIPYDGNLAPLEFES
jgi:superfamily II DNA or RNA helicase